MYDKEKFADHGSCKSKGPSSAWLHDPEIVLGHIPLKSGQVFADLGCGSGDYSVAASALVGDGGKVYAFDKWESLVEGLAERTKEQGLDNVIPMTADILSPLPLEDKSVDVVFITTVLHIFNLQKIAPSFFPEVYRVLKSGGIMAIVECKKEERNFGPPKEMCHSPEEIQAVVQPCSFIQTDYTSFEHTYLLQFTTTVVPRDLCHGA